VYWTELRAGLVRKVAKQGGVPTTLASKQSSPGRVAVDQTHVYATVGAATSSAPYGLLRVGKTDQEARFVVPDVAIWGLAHDTVAVYYTIIVPSVEPPQLWRLAK